MNVAEVMFNLADFTRRAFNSTYVETTRLTIHANCRLRRIFFMEKPYVMEAW